MHGTGNKNILSPWHLIHLTVAAHGQKPERSEMGHPQEEGSTPVRLVARWQGREGCRATGTSGNVLRTRRFLVGPVMCILCLESVYGSWLGGRPPWPLVPRTWETIPFVPNLSCHGPSCLRSRRAPGRRSAAGTSTGQAAVASVASMLSTVVACPRCPRTITRLPRCGTEVPRHETRPLARAAWNERAAGHWLMRWSWSAGEQGISEATACRGAMRKVL